MPKKFLNHFLVITYFKAKEVDSVEKRANIIMVLQNDYRKYPLRDMKQARTKMGGIKAR